jgi:hypothetical protein
MELASCHPSGTWNFEEFLENLCASLFIHTCISAYSYTIHMVACHGLVFNPLVSYRL